MCRAQFIVAHKDSIIPCRYSGAKSYWSIWKAVTKTFAMRCLWYNHTGVQELSPELLTVIQNSKRQRDRGQLTKVVGYIHNTLNQTLKHCSIAIYTCFCSIRSSNRHFKHTLEASWRNIVERYTYLDCTISLIDWIRGGGEADSGICRDSIKMNVNHHKEVLIYMHGSHQRRQINITVMWLH